MKKRVSPSVSYDEGLLEDLKNPEFAVIYLNSVLLDSGKKLKERFLTALSFVAKAHGVSKLSVETKLQRESLRKALSEKGNPTISTLLVLLKAFGLRLRLEAEDNLNQTSKQPPVEGPSLSELQQQLSTVQQTMEEIKKLAENTAAISGSQSSATQRSQTLQIEGGSPMQLKTINTQEGTKNVH